MIKHVYECIYNDTVNREEEEEEEKDYLLRKSMVARTHLPVVTSSALTLISVSPKTIRV